MPLTISNVAVARGAASFTVTWTTNEAASSQVLYGPTTALGLTTPVDAAPKVVHSVRVGHVLPDRTYFFQAKSVSAVVGFTVALAGAPPAPTGAATRLLAATRTLTGTRPAPTGALTAVLTGAGFVDPSSVANLTGWWAADAIPGLADNDPVATWNDAAGTNTAVTQATPASRPVYKTGVVNGKPVVRFDGTDDFLQATGVAGSALFATGAGTVFVVQKHGGANPDTGTLCWDSTADATNRVVLSLPYAGALVYDAGNAVAGGRLTAGTPAGWADAFHVIQVHRPAATGNGEILVDGAAVASGLFTDDLDTTATADLTLGAFSMAGTEFGFFDGDLAEVVVYSRELTATERANVQTWLANKYGVALSGTAAPATQDEFHGPFASWRNAKTADGATGDGIADDTAALQAWLDHATASKYLPPGTYNISAPLTLTQRRGVRLIGDDPATTSIRWVGAAGDESRDAPVHRDMLRTNGVSYSSVSRITFDGGGVAGVTAVNQAWDNTGAIADNGNEYVDLIVQDVAHGIRIGSAGAMGSEVMLRRCEFLRCSQGGVGTYNYNALDIWVADCLFEDCYVAVTNEGHGHGHHVQAGNYHVYRTTTRRSGWAAYSMCNTSQTFCVRDSVSYQDNAFFMACGIGAPGAAVTIDGCQILDPTLTLTPDRTSNFTVKPWRACIEMGNPGPLLVMDTTFRMPPTWDAGTMVVVHVAQEYSGEPTADVTLVFNTFSTGSYVSAQGDVVDYGTSVVDRSTVPTPERATARVTHAPKVARQVLEPAAFTSAAIATQIAAAAAYAGQRPVVHLPAGTYTGAGITIPVGSDLQLEGDGWDTGGTVLEGAGGGNWQLTVAGPGSRAVVRDLKVNGASASHGLRLTAADQAGGRVVGDQVLSFNAQVCCDVVGLDSTLVRFDGCEFHALESGTLATMRITGGAVLAAGGAGTGGVLLLGTANGGSAPTYAVSAGGQLVVLDGWWESGTFNTFLNLTDSGRVHLNGFNVQAAHGSVVYGVPDVTLNDWDGDFAMVSCNFSNPYQARRYVTGTGTTTRALFLNVIAYQYPAGAQFDVDSPNAAVLVAQSKRAIDDGWTEPIADAAYNVADAPAFIAALLARIRAAGSAVPPAGVQGAPAWAQVPAVPAGATDVWLSRVFVDATATGLEVGA